MEIIGIQLVDGTYVICQEESCTDTQLITKNPLSVVTYQDENGKIMLRIIPYCIHADEYDDSNNSCECKFEKTGILAYYKPNKQLLRKYDEIYGTGIIVPNQNLLM